MSVRIVAPFIDLLLWGVILAVALEPLHAWLAARMGGRQGLASTVLVVGLLLLIGLPMVMLGTSFANHIEHVISEFHKGSLAIPSPPAKIANWPIVGEQIHQVWSSAATDLPAFVSDHRVQLENLSRRVLSAAANTLVGVLLFLSAMIIAAIMMAYVESGSRAIRRIFVRLTDPVRGTRLQNLATATIRSVAVGVIGVAFIQAILLGVGFIFAGIPAAGVLALVVMFLGILQVPAIIVSIPAIAYLWIEGDGSTGGNIAFTIYFVIAGMADNVLKPLLLGRGVDAPMVIILIGAIGGMITGGIIGLFVGGVVLAVTYQLVMEWVSHGEAEKAS
jgi:predicted PurR-regulated permease PerM